MSAASVLCLLHAGPADGEELSYDNPPGFITVEVKGTLGRRRAHYQRAGGTSYLTHYECVEPDC